MLYISVQDVHMFPAIHSKPKTLKKEKPEIQLFTVLYNFSLYVFPNSQKQSNSLNAQCDTQIAMKGMMDSIFI